MAGGNTQNNSNGNNNTVVSNQRTAREAALKKRRKGILSLFAGGEMDKSFFLIVLVLLVYGIVMMFSASYIEGMTEYQDGYHFVKAQAFAAVLGIAVMLILSFWDYHFFQKRWVALSAFGILTVIMLYTSLFGYENAGAKRWLVIPGMGMVQPSEFYKLALIILLSWWITRQLKKPVDMKTQVIFYTLVLGLCGGLLFLQRHMSGVMIFMIIGMGIIFIGGIKWKTLGRLILVLAVCMVVMLIAATLMGKDFSYIFDRLQAQGTTTEDISSSELSAAEWQTVQSKIAIGSGGLFGMGFGESRQKYMWLPESQNDFIFPIVCEELGFIGGMSVVALFALFIYRGFAIATKAPDGFGMLLCSGIIIQIGAQALLNIMVACDLFPNTGISLPFFSYGGTALLLQLAEMGIVLNISRQGNVDE